MTLQGVQLRGRVKMAKSAKTKASAKPKGPRGPKKIRGFDRSAVISFGKGYDAGENNPKRGTAAARFAKYREGMTVQKALDVGMKVADISYDAKSGFIKLAAA
jgi:hypothetical protein